MSMTQSAELDKLQGLQQHCETQCNYAVLQDNQLFLMIQLQKSSCQEQMFFF